MIIFLKKILKLIIAFIIAYSILSLLLVGVAHLYDNPIRNTISSKITQKNIQRLILGTSEKEIIKILGEPFNQIKQNDLTIFCYAKEGLPFGTGIEVYVYIKNKKYVGIRIEEFDLGVYVNTLKQNFIDNNKYNKLIPRV